MSSVLPSFAAIQRRQRVHAAVRELLAEQGFRISMDAVAALRRGDVEAFFVVGAPQAPVVDAWQRWRS